MTKTEITASQIKTGDNISALWAGCVYTGTVRAVDPAIYSSRKTGTEHILITFVGGSYWVGQDQSITIPASQVVDLNG